MAEPGAAAERPAIGLEPVRRAASTEAITAAYDLHQRELYSFARRAARDAEAAPDGGEHELWVGRAEGER